MGLGWSTSSPESILERSRTSLTSWRSVVPLERIAFSASSRSALSEMPN